MKHKNLWIIISFLTLVVAYMFFNMERDHFLFSMLAAGSILIIALFWWYNAVNQ